ncbi:PTS system cellobiose-specific IIC component [Breznakia sp. PF5-3]|uniref:PTS sugar transporter subunit IIC n=1 Tax=unclassified Breznakia TaxID=2623764 RepID=UPI002406420B|nr:MULTISPECIES: PTS transporter subunit EIIC [unclassified Breznakia]MDL2276656.1 PTS transporter subunit EIIC [Breznakia sp. OttesenSCG-928-G09]MDF9824830.1 PTS system cellobiose-specific IIC component [Breznakia sp. PM6-1]MDF9835208.1 PTS system cellobiose-specific IIC component [Breznakia sp. PF5-3]MDF9837320.1 PTS system cellobiose-specific IIC component [Breznakia sp. PFB2-8]MDF9859756.1 PTS system cellobiose-specific IIC component [Breznakia sp. PH5-24]
MKKFSEFLQNKLVPITNKFAQLPFMIVLRNSVMTIVPLMIVGAIGTFMTNIPFEGIAKVVEPAAPFFSSLATVTANISGLVVAIAIGYFGAKHYKLDSIFGITTSVASFFAATLTPDLVIDTSTFGASGMFTAMIVGFFSVYIIHLCKKYHIEIKMPDGVPPMVAGSFSVIIALAISVSLVLLVRIGLDFDINAAITELFSPIANGLNTLPGYLLYSLLACLLFICGINPAVIIGFLIPVMAMNGEANAAAVAAGTQPEGFVTWGMYTIMCCGGTGSTIGLTILALFSKAKVHKTLGKISIFPGAFNINEPIIYGFPIMFNPIMIIPFILVPVINITSTWLLMSANIIGRPFVEIPWSTPPIFNGFLMSGGDLRTAVWTGVLVLISVACYYPFFKIAEKQELLNEQEEATAE